ncbi:MAG TPA: hypothetical protein GYA07_16755 [Verrucomicrobia bacterium]|nr:hypothetical protein [Verrucomicrobiota bacterium]
MKREVESTLPLLDSITGATTNAPGQKGTAEAIADVLSGILNQNTNTSGEPQPAGTNVISDILRGVLGTNAPPPATPGAGIDADLAALRQHLRAIQPILNRLDSETLSTRHVGAGDSTNNLERTGRD